MQIFPVNQVKHTPHLKIHNLDTNGNGQNLVPVSQFALPDWRPGDSGAQDASMSVCQAVLSWADRAGIGRRRGNPLSFRPGYLTWMDGLYFHIHPPEASAFPEPGTDGDAVPPAG